MIRTLIAVAIAASAILYAPAAHSDDTMVDRVLRITIVTKSPKHSHVRTVSMPYQTRFACENAKDELDLQVILKSLKADFATAACVSANSNI